MQADDVEEVNEDRCWKRRRNETSGEQKEASASPLSPGKITPPLLLLAGEKPPEEPRLGENHHVTGISRDGVRSEPSAGSGKGLVPETASSGEKVVVAKAAPRRTEASHKAPGRKPHQEWKKPENRPNRIRPPVAERIANLEKPAYTKKSEADIQASPNQIGSRISQANSNRAEARRQAVSTIKSVLGIRESALNSIWKFQHCATYAAAYVYHCTRTLATKSTTVEDANYCTFATQEVLARLLTEGYTLLGILEFLAERKIAVYLADILPGQISAVGKSITQLRAEITKFTLQKIPEVELSRDLRDVINTQAAVLWAARDSVSAILALPGNACFID